MRQGSLVVVLAGSPPVTPPPPRDVVPSYRLCSLCCSRREVAADARLCASPLSGVPLSAKLRDWCSRRDMAPLTADGSGEFSDELPLCGSCLDFVLDVERVERSYEELFALLWQRLAASPFFVPVGGVEDPDRRRRRESVDVIHAAALEAGIFEETSAATTTDSQHQPQQPAPEFEASTSTPSPSPAPAIRDEHWTLVVRKKRQTRHAKRRKGADVEVEEEGEQEREREEEDGGTGEREKYGIIVVERRRRCEDEDFKENFFSRAELDNDEPFDKEREPTETRRGRRRRRGPDSEGDKEVRRRVCPICGALLKAKESDLQKHIRVVHSKEKKIECQFCSERFLYHRHLYRHQLEVHQYEAIPFQQMCELCGKVMGKKWCMKDHMLAVHGIEPKNRKVHTCPRCGKKFLDSNRFKSHVNSHEGIRPYKCPACDVSMTRLENLRQHSKKVHGLEVGVVEVGSHHVVVKDPS